MLQPLADVDNARIDDWLAPLRDATRDELVKEGVAASDIEKGDGLPATAETVSVHGLGDDVSVYDRDSLRAGQRFDGPAIVRETVTTTWIAPAWSAEIDAKGKLLLEQR